MAASKHATNKDANKGYKSDNSKHVNPVPASPDKAMNPGPKPGNA